MLEKTGGAPHAQRLHGGTARRTKIEPQWQIAMRDRFTVFQFPCKYQEKAGRVAHGAPIYRGAGQRGPHFQGLEKYRGRTAAVRFPSIGRNRSASSNTRKTSASQSCRALLKTMKPLFPMIATPLHFVAAATRQPLSPRGSGGKPCPAGEPERKRVSPVI